jgi:hypothetical protein
MRYELVGHRVRVYAVSIALLGVLVSAAVWYRGDTLTAPTAATSSNASAAAMVLMVADSPQGTGVDWQLHWTRNDHEWRDR